MCYKVKGIEIVLFSEFPSILCIRNVYRYWTIADKKVFSLFWLDAISNYISKCNLGCLSKYTLSLIDLPTTLLMFSRLTFANCIAHFQNSFLSFFSHHKFKKKMSQSNTDCYFFYYSSCSKGNSCQFRHEPAALNHETVCAFWKKGSCTKPHCMFR